MRKKFRISDEHGVFAYSDVKAKNMDEGDGNSPGGFHYDEPFGDYRERFGTEIFPHFDFRSSSIIQ